MKAEKTIAVLMCIGAIAIMVWGLVSLAGGGTALPVEQVITPAQKKSRSRGAAVRIAFHAKEQQAEAKEFGRWRETVDKAFWPKKEVSTPYNPFKADVQELIAAGAVSHVNIEFNELRISPVIWANLPIDNKQGLLYMFAMYFEAEGSTGRAVIRSDRNDTKLGSYSSLFGARIFR